MEQVNRWYRAFYRLLQNKNLPNLSPAGYSLRSPLMGASGADWWERKCEEEEEGGAQVSDAVNWSMPLPLLPPEGCNLNKIIRE